MRVRARGKWRGKELQEVLFSFFLVSCLVSSLFAFDLVSSVRAVTDFDIFKAATDYAIIDCVCVCGMWSVDCGRRVSPAIA